MRIATVSDIHGRWNEINYPPADVLVFAGDIFHNYSWDKADDAVRQLEEARALNTLLGQLRGSVYREIVSGNHDRCFAHAGSATREVLTNAKYLEDEAADILGKKFYGSPWQPWFGGNVWVFNFPDPEENRARARGRARQCWDLIPDDTEVLITHTPARGMRDYVSRGENVGCPELAARIPRLTKLQLHVFGHIHTGRGMEQLKVGDRSVLCVNTAMVTDDIELQGDPFVVEIS